MSDAAEPREPSILVPYAGPAEDSQNQDIILYLRPQYNGVEVESTLLKIVEKQEGYRRDLKLVYLANLPGDFIARCNIIERHYALRMHYARHGARAFTPRMRQAFREWTGEDPTDDTVVGSFEAVKALQLSPQELFSLWVERKDLLKVLGQSIKRVQSPQGKTCYVVNYDIPALLHMNSRQTDIAVMMFRSSLGYKHFRTLIDDVEIVLRKKGLVNKRRSAKHLFHYSEGPFDELLDACGHLLHTDSSVIEFHELSFSRYLYKQGISYEVQRGMLGHPLVIHEGEEQNIFEATRGMSYEEAFRFLERVSATYLFNPHLQNSQA